MYLLNRGYFLKVDEDIELDGIIINGASLCLPEVERRNIPETKILLFDPQLYFSINYLDKRQKTFCNLSTYPWFNDSPPEYDSGVIKLKEFKKAIKENNTHQEITIPSDENDIRNRIRACIDFQVNLGVTHIVLPVPLVDDSEDGFTTQLVWIQIGTEEAQDYDIPKLVTVAITDSVLVNKKFEENNLIQTIIDNLTALNEIDGFYLTIERSNNTTNVIEKSIVQYVLELSYLLGSRIGKKVFFNHLDNLGFLALAVGATAFGSGYTNKERRLNFNDFIDKDSGGAPLPRFYSHQLIGDFYPQRDLYKIRDARLLRYIYKDDTEYSKSLIDFLKTGKDVSKLIEWKESLNNITTAKLHRMVLMIRETNYLNSLSFEEKLSYTLEWLQDAESKKYHLDMLFKEDPLSEDCRHITVWKNCFEEFITKYKLL